MTRSDLKLWAKDRSDGCTHAFELYKECCFMHDFMYQTGINPFTTEVVTRRQADAIFRRCLQKHSPLKKGSPMAWWRWIAVRAFARKAWHGDRQTDTTPSEAA